MMTMTTTCIKTQSDDPAVWCGVYHIVPLCRVRRDCASLQSKEGLCLRQSVRIQGSLGLHVEVVRHHHYPHQHYPQWHQHCPQEHQHQHKLGAVVKRCLFVYKQLSQDSDNVSTLLVTEWYIEPRRKCKDVNNAKVGHIEHQSDGVSWPRGRFAPTSKSATDCEPVSMCQDKLLEKFPWWVTSAP